jgi:hypothetical protein
VRTPAACSTSSRSAASAAACDALLAARAFSAAQQQHRRPRRHVGVHYRSSSDQLAAQQQSLRITPDTSIDAAVAAAIAAVGRTPGPAEQQLVCMCVCPGCSNWHQPWCAHALSGSVRVRCWQRQQLQHAPCCGWAHTRRWSGCSKTCTARPASWQRCLRRRWTSCRCL